MDIFETIGKYRFIPVLTLTEVSQALPRIDALTARGLPLAEITFRTPAGAEALALAAAERPEVLLGAGTVLSAAQVDTAVQAGAQFAVSPGCSPWVIERCLERGLTVIPGCSSATDIERALSYGLKVVKFFPAEALGGVRMLKALSGPFPGLRFVPTGGITAESMPAYLALDCVLACGGSV